MVRQCWYRAAWLSAVVSLGCSSETNTGSAGAPNEAGSASAGTSGTAEAPSGGSGGSRAGGASGADATGGELPGVSSTVACRATGDGKSTITLINHCTSPLTFAGSLIAGGTLAPGEHACRDVGSAVESIPAIRYWGYVGNDPGGEKYTLAELTLNTTFNDFDWYNISHVDASNLPMRVQPVDMPKCRVLTCAESLLADCPAAGQLEDANGSVISCVSPDRDNPDSVVAQYFEAKCVDAYSWSGDDSDSVAACAGEDYDVLFCP